MNTSGRTRAGRHGDSLQVRISNQFSSKPDEGLSKVVVRFGRNVIVLKILLSAEDNGLCLNLSVLNIHFVATQHDQDVLTHSYQISMPVRHIVVSNSRCYISRPAVSHTLNLIGLLGMEQKRMDLNTQGSYIFLKFTSQVKLHFKNVVFPVPPSPTNTSLNKTWGSPWAAIAKHLHTCLTEASFTF